MIWRPSLLNSLSSMYQNSTPTTNTASQKILRWDLHTHTLQVCPVSITLRSQQTPSDFCKQRSRLMWFLGLAAVVLLTRSGVCLRTAGPGSLRRCWFLAGGWTGQASWTQPVWEWIRPSERCHLFSHRVWTLSAVCVLVLRRSQKTTTTFCPTNVMAVCTRMTGN